CPKTPQDYSKEGRLKPFFANNVDIPFARARRLRPCPRKASTRNDPGRREMHVLIEKNPAVTSLFISITKIKRNKTSLILISSVQNRESLVTYVSIVFYRYLTIATICFLCGFV